MRARTVACLVAFMAVVWSAPVRAQETGVKIGRLWSDIRGGGEGVSYERRAAWSLGLYTHLRAGVAKVRAEILYSRRGAEPVEAAAPAAAPQRFELDYVEVPVVVELGDSPTLFLGGYGALNVASRLVSGSGDARTELDLSDNVESFDYGVVVGAAVRFSGVILEGRYVQGLKRLFKPDPTSTAPELKHRAIGVYLSFGL